ncbi:Pullulanase 1, chloroplastic [Vitis vinifera]|uniref:Pullulanase 1, chloroplastic n=1 Tax=Vitis vinifera TaxID=29760 RepID=A0A438DU91_VITVI|nr:Pullulanase 1, chloroplastic [Vitis vinifera]
MALSLSPPLSLLPITPSSNPNYHFPSRFAFKPFPTSTPLSFPTLPRTFHNQPISFCSCLPMPLEVSTSTAQYKQMDARKRYASPVISFYALELDFWLQDSLLYSRAYWVSESIIAWNVDVGDGSCYLYSSKIAALSIGDSGITGHDMTIQLEEDNGGLPINVIEKFPQLQGYKAFKVPQAVDAKSLIKCQLAVAAFS